MGTAIYGGSPRHNPGRRISVGNTASGMTNASMLSGVGSNSIVTSQLVHSSPALHQPYHAHAHHHQQQHSLQLLQHHSVHVQQQQSFTAVHSEAGSAALIMNHSSSTIIFPPPTSFNSVRDPQPPSSLLSASGNATASTTPTASGAFASNQQYHHQRQYSKRKSAVELLAESKAFYVKSETVLERPQHPLYYAGSRPAPNCGSMQTPSEFREANLSPSRLTHHMRNASTASSLVGGQPTGAYSSSSGNRRCVSTSSTDLLQTKLRTLLNTPSVDQGSADDYDQSNSRYQFCDHPHGQPYSASPKKHSQELSVLPDQNSDIAAFFPSAFLSPQSLPPHPSVADNDIFTYGVEDSMGGFQTISPPAEYAEDHHITAPKTNRHNTATQRSAHQPALSNAGRSYAKHYSYQRSFSHSPSATTNQSTASPGDEPHPMLSTASALPTGSADMNSHKSLPDLHTQISRHSPHSEALSICSRGARSNKSGSSFNRDSGGSSGHYTHRSEPNSSGNAVLCTSSSAATSSGGGIGGRYASSSASKTQHNGSQQGHSHSHHHHQQQHSTGGSLAGSAGATGNPPVDYRRDSGSSTQHSGNSYYAYGIPPTMRYDCSGTECRTTKIGLPDPPAVHPLQQYTDDRQHQLLDFNTTPEVPEAFQDNYEQRRNSTQQHSAAANTAQLMMQMMVGVQKPPLSMSGRNSREKLQQSVPDIRASMHHHSYHHQQQQQQHHVGRRLSGNIAAYRDEDANNTLQYRKIPSHHSDSSPARMVKSAPLMPLSLPPDCGTRNVINTQPDGEISPPLGTFKRQRCLRVKQRDRFSSPSDRNSRSGADADDSSLDRRPILRSKSDVSDRQQWGYRIGQPQQAQHRGQMADTGNCVSPPATVQRSYAEGGSTSGSAQSMSVHYAHRPVDALSQLERFFDRLGLQEDVYEACIAPHSSNRAGRRRGSATNTMGDYNGSDNSSPVFFSDASTVDSTRLPDSTETPAPVPLQMPAGQQPNYRPSEPPSIVERNARIIKWLCACRKSQLA